MLTPADGGSGMSGGSAKTEYSTNGGASWATGTALSFIGWRRGGGTGTYTILARSTDAVGNVESPRTVTVLLDSRAPMTTDNAPAGAQASPVTVTFTGVDAHSGIKEIWYSVDGGTWTKGTSALIPAPADHSNDGRHTIRYYSVDNAGNRQVGYSVCSVTIAT